MTRVKSYQEHVWRRAQKHWLDHNFAKAVSGRHDDDISELLVCRYCKRTPDEHVTDHVGSCMFSPGTAFFPTSKVMFP